jgi:proteic killer suppression protein
MFQGAVIQIAWSDRKLAKHCRTDTSGQKHFGPIRWKLLRRRLGALEAALVLSDMRGVGGFHALGADLEDHFAVNLDGPYRLIFKPHHNPIPLLDSGGIDKAAVTQVLIMGIVDYHG